LCTRPHTADSGVTIALVTFCTLFLFSFHGPATTEIYTLSLHDALPIFALADAIEDARARGLIKAAAQPLTGSISAVSVGIVGGRDRKSTRLNSSHVKISYAVFCLKKKTKKQPLGWQDDGYSDYARNRV